ncbi:chaperonin GroES [Thermosulfidibacter takaii ABI70S6]|uniref:Co-chaperonin GroES n=1 Tax=Thermosulfidibacter takaii (strain DSM 17441 / JCM 13301 / NBRC 103674 / ABI70S6) TaxID=1298851 RepID=A0A0S3QUI8_THET7|nr:co-chaperone GroES [Thermosulfidibacter takaii]BAT71988.1 chaperonin GroES [Thermosulfidibacter takaii ABI70S6]
MKIQPLYDRVLVKPYEEEEKRTKGGIIIPDTAKEKPQRGKVVAVGEGRILENGQRVPLTVKVGDEVIFGKYAGTEIEVDDEKYLVMREEDIYAIIKE